MIPSNEGCCGYRAVFFRELSDSTGHGWNVPIVSIVIFDASTSGEALEKAFRQFESRWTCGKWSDVASLVEIEEIGADPSAAERPVAAKRIIRAHH